MPPDVFKYLPSVQYIDLSHNEIVIIDSDAFVSLTTLELLNLEGNKLTGIKLRNKSLTTLNLRKNQILKLSDKSFEELPNLNKVDLSVNAIQSISDYAFVGLSNLQFLQLGSNEIASIPTQAFQHTPLLVDLGLSYNSLSVLYAAAFIGLRCTDSNRRPTDYDSVALTS